MPVCGRRSPTGRPTAAACTGLDDAPEEAQRMGNGEPLDAFLTALNTIADPLPVDLALSVV